MGLSVIQQFTDEGVVSQSGLRRGLFTVGDTDTIYHKFTIRLQQPLQNIFHDTAILLFHARSTMDDGQKRDIPVVPSGQGKITPPVKHK